MALSDLPRPSHHRPALNCESGTHASASLIRSSSLSFDLGAAVATTPTLQRGSGLEGSAFLHLIRSTYLYWLPSTMPVTRLANSELALAVISFLLAMKAREILLSSSHSSFSSRTDIERSAASAERLSSGHLPMTSPKRRAA